MAPWLDAQHQLPSGLPQVAVDITNGDGRPFGPLLTDLMAKVVDRDASKTARRASDAKGAYGLDAPTPSWRV